MRRRSALHAISAPPRTTRAQALARTERLTALTHLASSPEHLASPAERRPGGVHREMVVEQGLLDRTGPAPSTLDDGTST